MKTLTLKLRQHTPLIHFQHYQDNATLRASEVKPLLDRFILNTLGNGDYEAGRQVANERDWLVSSDYGALNYRLRISTEKGKKVPVYNINKLKDDARKGKKLLPYPLYFGNMNADYNNPEEFRRFSFPDVVYLKFYFSPLSDGNGRRTLYEYLADSDLLSRFFMRTNFGTRASKGFGSFYVSDDDDLYVSPDEIHSGYSFVVNLKKWPFRNLRVNGTEEYEKLFKTIEIFYKSLRSGINELKGKDEHVFCFKSLAYKYCTERLEKKWDKRAILEAFYGEDNRWDVQACDIKDMFGFSTDEQWKKQGDKLEKRINGRGNNQVPTRMQSPLLFKPIYKNRDECAVYLIFKENEVKLDKFIQSGNVKVKSRLRGKSVLIDFPASFSFTDFFNYILDSLELDTYVEQEFQNHLYFKILDNIFGQLKKQN